MLKLPRESNLEGGFGPLCKVVPPAPTAPFEVWKPHSPGIEVNGRGQLRTNFPLEEEKPLSSHHVQVGDIIICSRWSYPWEVITVTDRNTPARIQSTELKTLLPPCEVSITALLPKPTHEPWQIISRSSTSRENSATSSSAGSTSPTTG